MSALARLWALREDRPVFVLCSVAALSVFVAWPLVDWVLRGAGIAPEFGFYDYGAYGTAVGRWFAGESIYWTNDAGSYWGSYLYSPAVLPVFAPFAMLPFRQGVFLWLLTTLGLLWIVVQLVVASYGIDLARWERGLLLWLLLGFQPLLFGLKLGQVTALLGALMFVALLGIRRENAADGRAASYASGAATSLAAAFKLFYATAGAHLLADRDRFTGAAATALGLAGLSLLVFGVEANRTFLEVLFWGKGWGTDPRAPYLWGAGYYQPMHAIADLSPLVRVVGVVVVAGLALAAGPDATDEVVFALGAAAVPFLGPSVHGHDLVVLLSAFVALLAFELRRDGGRPVVPVIAILLVNLHAYLVKLMVSYLPPAPPTTVVVDLVPVLQPGLWGNVLLLALAAVRVAEAATVPQWLAASVPRWSFPK